MDESFEGLPVAVLFDAAQLDNGLSAFGDPYVVARELVDTRDYYVSHASAMDIHQMVTQPQLAVFVTSPKAIRRRDVLGTEFRFVRCIDGLKQSEHCGGFTEVARACPEIPGP